MTLTTKKKQGIDYVSLLNSKKVPFAIRAMRWYIKLLNVFSTNKAAKLVTKLFLTPQVKPLSEDKQSWYDRGKQEYLEIEDKEIFVWRSGDKPSVLLLHGWGSSSYRLKRLIDYLVTQDYDVLAFDMPAHGLSNGKKTNLLEIERVTARIMSKFPSIEHTIGYSFGGLVLLRPITQSSQIKNYISLAAPKRIESITGTFFAMFDVPEEVQYKFYKNVETLVNIPKEQWSTIDNQELQRVNILQIHDKDDIIVPILDARLFQEVQSHSELVETEGLGHRGLLKSEQVFDEICRFLEK